ncbi:MAG: Hsp70 family protein [Anaerolineaceae bacterium]|nr:Hsp70 family protein [Anaerolineaceae bacterium]
MSNKLAVDFGNSNTVTAVWDDEARSAEVLYIPGLSGKESFLIPSRIVYEPDGRTFAGYQTEDMADPEAREFRWMKRYIGLRSPYALHIGENRIDAKRAAEDFLHIVTASAMAKISGNTDELIISVPVESFEHYSNWLLSEMKRFDDLRLRIIDEASAAAAGYGLSLHPGDTLLVADFGGSTLQAVCVTVDEEGEKNGRCCRVLGKAGCSLGGMTLDRWIFEDVLDQLKLSENDPPVHRNSGALLKACEKAKIRLSETESFVFDFFPDHPLLFTQERINHIFASHGLFDSLDTVLKEALRTAEDHGLVRESLTAVLPVGGSSLIPAIRAHLEAGFTGNKVVCGEPLGAVARGASVIAGGMHIYDFIQHSYAIRYTDPQTGEYAFRTIVPKGTRYPQSIAAGPMRLKASFNGQQHFGIAVYELREGSVHTQDGSEIFFDMDGGVHVIPLTDEESRSEQRFWLNEQNPLFLSSETPGEKGVPRFEISFGIDPNKMLTINVSNLIQNHPVLENYPVVRLT